MTPRPFVLPALLGFLAVAFGAFGAHSLKPWLMDRGTWEIWQTAVVYHLAHALAGLWAAERSGMALILWTAGTLCFSGSLYLLAVTGVRGLGLLTPLGGLLFLGGWVAAALARKNA